jgi:Cu(I)-responsive transcriptional regulator
MEDEMNIGQAARRSGVSAKTIRYYEEIGLIPAAVRTGAGYRDYGEAEIETLRFIQRARSLGFSVKDVGGLLALWRDRSRASADVRRIARDHVLAVEQKIAELEGMRRTLVALIDRCHGDDRPDCPILDGLSDSCCH